MSDNQWVVIPNWDKFQHYKDRDPVWIKLYTGLNSRDDWLQLSIAERGLLCTAWIEYARSAEHLRVENVRRLCAGKARQKHWTSLSDAGFVELSASKPLALARSREKEKRHKDLKQPVENQKPGTGPELLNFAEYLESTMKRTP